MASELGCNYTGTNNIYCTILRESDSFVYEVATGDYVAYVALNWTDYALPLVEVFADRYAVDMPTSPVTVYVVTYREELVAGVPSDTDIILETNRFYFNGSILLPVPPIGVVPPVLCDQALVDTNTFKRYLNIDYDNTQSDYVLIDILNYITSKMTKLADRKWKIDTHREKIFTNGYGNVQVRNWPVKYISHISSGTQAGMKLSHSGDELRVTAGCSTGRKLIIQSISSIGVETVTTLDFDDYLTLALLAAKINADVTNVSATVVKNAPSNDIWDYNNVQFTNTKMQFDIISQDNIEYQLNGDIGAISIDGSVPNWVYVEYRGGFDSGCNEPEYYHAQEVTLDCGKLIYDKIAKDSNLKSNQFDQGKSLNVQSYFSTAEIDKMILVKINDFKDFALGEF